jgi:4a-hydroxytetrahydrobiopterin dehydratase
MSDLATQSCRPCEGGVEPLDPDRARTLLAQVPGWRINDDGDMISREFSFENFHQTMAFINAMAWIAHQQDHHPDFEAGYKRCVISYTTICAARLNRLLGGA